MMDEKSLISKAKRGDLDTFNQIVLLHQDVVFRFACSLLTDDQAAEDCTQDAFLRAFQHMSELRSESFRPWIMKIVRNACIDELRRRNHYANSPLFFQHEVGEEVERIDLPVVLVRSVEEKVEQAELRSFIHQHLNLLPDKYRSVLVVVDLLDMDYKEAATVLNIPVGTIKSRLARGRRRLSRSIQSQRELLWQVEGEELLYVGNTASP
jgi:RNA polymerase sigma-70 factor, ECF subfamily